VNFDLPRWHPQALDTGQKHQQMSDVLSLHKIMIVGAGTMGAGIAAIYAAAGREVILVDPDLAARERALSRFRAVVEQLSNAVHKPHLSLIPDIDDATEVELVIEAVPEIPDIKRALYRRLFKRLPPRALVASNTSSLLPDDLVGELPTSEAARFAICHYWHPPHRLPLVEIVPGSRTAPETTESLKRIVAGTGSHPIVLNKAIPGFIGNRLQFAMLREALYLVELGIASPETVDEVVRLSLGRRYLASGPIEAADLGGLATFEKIAALLIQQLAHSTEGMQLLKERVSAGCAGAHTGEGFYKWTDERRSKVAQRQAVAHTVLRMQEASGS